MDGLTEGRIVHFVLSNGQHRPAIIVKVINKQAGIVNLQVFTDGKGDGVSFDTAIIHSPNTPFSEAPVSYTWHWIEKA